MDVEVNPEESSRSLPGLLDTQQELGIHAGLPPLHRDCIMPNKLRLAPFSVMRSSTSTGSDGADGNPNEVR